MGRRIWFLRRKKNIIDCIDLLKGFRWNLNVPIFKRCKRFHYNVGDPVEIHRQRLLYLSIICVFC